MANKTPNYGLTKPLPEEFYDIAVQNENMDIIDSKLKELSNSSPDVSGQIKTHDTDENAHADIRSKISGAITAAEEAKSHASDKNNPHSVTVEQIGAAPAYTYGTEDLVAGTSALESGKLHFVYE